MNININYTFSLEILLMICFLYIILVSNTFCSCCNIEKVIENVKSFVNSQQYASEY
jgi:hypothetical protein